MNPRAWKSGSFGYAVLLLLFLCASNSALSGAEQGSNPVQKHLSELVRDPLPAGVTRSEIPSFYKPDNLYEYIDGAADVYLLYDFQQLLHATFKVAKGELTIDIYDFGKAENAFGMYSAERTPQYRFVAIGVEGYHGEGALNFLQDHYYLKLAASGANASAALAPFARMLSRRIGGTAQAPAMLAKLPQEHRVPHSEQFVRKDPLGHAFLAPAYVVRYAWAPNSESSLVLSVASNAAGAKARVDQFAAHFTKSGKCASAPELGENGIRANNSFEGRVLARTQGRYLIALLNPPENGPEILKMTARALE